MQIDTLAMFILTYLFVFLAGSVMGSFLSVVLHRTRHNIKGTFMGRSMCPECRHKLKPQDLVPVISYLFLGGKCRYCKKKVALKYLAIETVTGLLTVGLFSKFIITENNPQLFAFWLILTLLLILIFFYDYEHQEIPLQFTIPLGIIGFIGANLILNLPILYLATGGAIGFAFFYFQYFVSKGKWVGLGDADLALAMGLIIGPGDIALTLFSGYILGSIVSIYLLVTKKAQSGSHIALGPFLIAGFYITLFYGTTLKNLILGL